ncbi:hypothetical protein Pyn_18170 [Prunus yedoensis var. nudiflora]|uniref:Uncharacterized protein n=1 Tax=Prunus yedoensis var. nudiflora TaxID=2094558 RepID=A0A314Y083_PRUYE|nr:hypothetical protein Pyn_18170 [Prunus yedoensis var. nudiflora]
MACERLENPASTTFGDGVHETQRLVLTCSGLTPRWRNPNLVWSYTLFRETGVSFSRRMTIQISHINFDNCNFKSKSVIQKPLLD